MLLAVVISYLSDVFGDKYSLDAKTRNALIITANGPVVWGGTVLKTKFNICYFLFKFVLTERELWTITRTNVHLV